MDEKEIKDDRTPDKLSEPVGEYTIDDMGLDSLCYHLREKFSGKTVEIFVLVR